MLVKLSSPIAKRNPRNASPAPELDCEDRRGDRASSRTRDAHFWQKFKNALVARAPGGYSKRKVKPSQVPPRAEKVASVEDGEDVPHELETSVARAIALPVGDMEPAHDIPTDASAKLQRSASRRLEIPVKLPPEVPVPTTPKLTPACSGIVEIQSEADGPWKQCFLELWTAHLSWSWQNQSGFNTAGDDGNCQFFLEPPCTVKTPSCSDVASDLGCILEVESESSGKLKVRCNVEGEVRPWMLCLQAAMETVEEKCRMKQWSFVYLNVYDLHQDRRVELFNWVMKDLLQAGGAFHAGVEVFKREYYYGSADENVTGISWCKPRQAPKHSFRQSICLGITCWDESRIKAQVRELMPEWNAQAYEVLTRNCMTFCRALCRKIGVQEAPDWIDALPLAAGERRLLQGQAVHADKPEDIQVRCSMGHECELVAQSFIAALVKTIACARCARQLRRGEPRWHCEACDHALCEPCVAQEAAQL